MGDRIGIDPLLAKPEFFGAQFLEERDHALAADLARGQVAPRRFVRARLNRAREGKVFAHRRLLPCHQYARPGIAGTGGNGGGPQ